MNAKKKIQLVLDEEAQATLQALQDSTGAGSMAEVLRDALGVYNSLRDMLTDGGGQKRLALIDRSAGELQELIIPSLLRGTAIVPGARSPMSGGSRKANAASSISPVSEGGEARI